MNKKVESKSHFERKLSATHAATEALSARALLPCLLIIDVEETFSYQQASPGLQTVNATTEIK